jgi:predicted neutral ceramidase superfamily lipid hydrolase
MKEEYGSFILRFLRNRIRHDVSLCVANTFFLALVVTSPIIWAEFRISPVWSLVIGFVINFLILYKFVLKSLIKEEKNNVSKNIEKTLNAKANKCWELKHFFEKIIYKIENKVIFRPVVKILNDRTKILEEKMSMYEDIITIVKKYQLLCEQ